MIPCIRVTPTVEFDLLTPAVIRILSALDLAARHHGVELTVTCGREGHPPGDPHTRGAALDIRTANLSPDLTIRVYQYLRSVLGDLFTVLYEGPVALANGALANIATVNPGATAYHFHVQVLKGTIYPPQDDTTTAA